LNGSRVYAGPYLLLFHQKYQLHHGSAIRRFLAVLEEKLGTQSLWEALRSGVVLCRLVNKIEPGAIKQFTNMKKMHALLERENINFYLEACWRLGMDSRDIFMTSDLYNARYMKSVLRNLTSLSHLAAKFDTISVLPIGPHPSTRYSKICSPEQYLDIDSKNGEKEPENSTNIGNLETLTEFKANEENFQVKIDQLTEQLEKARSEIRRLKKSNFTMQHMSISVPHLQLPQNYNEVSKLNLELSQLKRRLEKK